MKITGRNTAFTYAGAESKLGITCEKATPNEAKQITPVATNTRSSPQSRGQPVPKNRRPAHGQALQALAARDRVGRELVQERGGVLGLVLHGAAVAVAIDHPVAGTAGAGTELPRRALDDDPPVFDDRDAVGQGLRLVEI